MRRHNKLSAIMTSKSGASLLFVLGIMLLLMAIGTSALVAASAASGAGLNKQTGNQLNLYAESMHKAVMYSLKASKTLDGGKDVLSNLPDPSVVPETLGGQILAEVYREAHDAFAAEGGIRYEGAVALDIDVTPKLDGDTTGKLEEIYSQVKLSVAADVRIDKERDEEYFEVSGNELIAVPVLLPREASINAVVTVIVTTEAGTAGPQKKSLTSAATYRCVGGFLEGDATEMRIQRTGELEWEFVSYETYDH